MNTGTLQFGSFLIIIQLIAAVGVADNELVVFRKSIGDGKTIMVRESIREEHRGPTKAEQAEIDQLNQQLANDQKSKGASARWAKDRRLYHYTVSVNNTTNGVDAVWEKEVSEVIYPDYSAWTERLTVCDVVAKDDKLAIVYSSYREISVDVLKLEPDNRYALGYTQQVCGLGSEGHVTVIHIEWQKELLIHMQLSWLEHPEVWKVTKGYSERVAQPTDKRATP